MVALAAGFLIGKGLPGWGSVIGTFAWFLVLPELTGQMKG